VTSDNNIVITNLRHNVRELPLADQFFCGCACLVSVFAFFLLLMPEIQLNKKYDHEANRHYDLIALFKEEITNLPAPESGRAQLADLESVERANAMLELAIKALQV
jgi:hypothetical protein